MQQLALDGIVTRLLYRRDDPPTSRAAAVRAVRAGRLSASWAIFRRLLTEHGALTCNEAGALLAPRRGPTTWATEFNKRVSTWEHDLLIRRDGVRGGSRIWRLYD